MAATSGMAQTSPNPQTPAPTAAPPAAASVAEVVVTGSRISRRDYVSDSPIVTVGAAAVASSGAATLEGSLNQLPQVTTSASASANFVARGGQASVDLRGLGQQRTLVLVDGRRVQPSAPDGSADLNLIPSALIDSVEVITGGASAIYGSDAVAGVVNLKLKQHFKGAEIDTQYGVAGHGDGKTQNVTAVLGSDFADDKGNAYVALDYANRDIVRFTDRSYLQGQALSTNVQSSFVNVVSSNLPTQAAVNTVFAKYGVAPGTVSRSALLSTNPDNTLFVGPGAVNYRGPTTYPYKILNGSLFSLAGDDFYAQTPLTRYSLFGHADYKVSDDVTAYIDGFFTNYTVRTQGPPATAGSSSGKPLSVPINNPFIPADLATILASRSTPGANFTIIQAGYEFGQRGERDEYNVYQLTTGLQGKLEFADISWNAYASFGRTQYLATELNFPSSDALNRLLQAPDGGASLCAGGFNPFGIHALSPSCVAYADRNARNTTVLEQRVVELDTQGKLFDLPAGEVRFAAGADYRSNTYSFVPDALIQTGELANYLPVAPSSGSEDVSEVYGELLVPLVRDLPLAKEANLDLGYRYSDYNTVGGVSTYKADFDWKVVEAVRLRGGYARAIRAPSVGELFAASSQGQLALGTPGLIGNGDPCDIKGAYRAAGSAIAAQVRTLCLAQGIPANLVDSFTNQNVRTPFTTSGNNGLQPETSDTYSVGVVVRPPFESPLFSRISLSVDYYDIKLDHAIGIVTNTVATSQCFDTTANAPLNNANYFCQLITRDPTSGQITTIKNPELNLGGYETSGIDFEGDWSIPFEAVGLKAGLGTVTLSTVANRLEEFKIQTLAGGRTLDYVGTIGNTQIDQFADAHPRWKATSAVAWSVGPVQTSLRWRYIGSMANAINVGTGGTAHGVPSVSYFDLDAAWEVRPGLQLRGGVVNLGDKRPPTLNDSIVGNAATDLYTYDIVGRRFYVALKARF